MWLPIQEGKGLSLTIPVPHSPIDSPSKALRSRPFRRILLGLCVLLCIIASIHSITARPGPGPVIKNDSPRLHNHNGTFDYLANSPPPGGSIAEHSVDNFGSASGLEKSHALTELMQKLPEVIRIPFEEAVSDITLEGWEDDWFSTATFNPNVQGFLKEPKIDFVYNWVNGTDVAFKLQRHKFEVASPLNDREGRWITKHSINRYREWDELRYSFRSLDKYAKTFLNKIQLLVNPVEVSSGNGSSTVQPQRPRWLGNDTNTQQHVQVLSQEHFFDATATECLPSFDSLSLETQIHNTPSAVDQMVALSDDMFLAAPHSAADFYSPLFGPMFAFKQNHYNVKAINKAEIPTFGEKPYLYYTSWLLNHRFGERNRHVQAHLTHSISRRVMKEAMASFPSPALRGSCERFRGESQYQIYPWYAAFHYSIERFREALLWSFVMLKSDVNDDGYLQWSERQALLNALKPGRKAFAGEDDSTPVTTGAGRERLYYQFDQMQERAGLQPPLANVNVLWTSLDGPETIRHAKCHDFQVDKCFAESFDTPVSDVSYQNPDFMTANIFSQLSRREPTCGDCVIKFMLSTAQKGLEPLLPSKSHYRKREMIIKALLKYQHTVVDPDALFVMVKDAEQAQTELLDRTIRRDKKYSQFCLNDDVMTEDSQAVAKVNSVIQNVFQTLFPKKGQWEK